MTTPTVAPTRLSIKKYPNRRFYDSTRSQHVTLEDIHQLILDGNDVSITDSKTNRDITVNVLSQILLEMDSFKLGWFPSSLLHHIIRSNEPLVREFMDVYFNQAFEWFLQSRSTMEQQMRQMMGLGVIGQAEPDPAGKAMAGGATKPSPGQPDPDLDERIDRLTQSVEDLHSKLSSRPND